MFKLNLAVNGHNNPSSPLCHHDSWHYKFILVISLNGYLNGFILAIGLRGDVKFLIKVQTI